MSKVAHNASLADELINGPNRALDVNDGDRPECRCPNCAPIHEHAPCCARARDTKRADDNREHVRPRPLRETLTHFNDSTSLPRFVST